MVARAIRRAAEEDPHGPDPAHLASAYRPCAVCAGTPGRECRRCDGNGYEPVEEPFSADDAEACADFLRAEAFVREHSLAVWMALHGPPDPLFLEAMDVYWAAVREAEHEHRVKTARETRARTARAKRR